MVLREQQGLAYSLGSRISYRSGKDDSIWALWEITVGTRQENLDKVKEGIEKIINDFQDELINRDTIERISSSIAGRQMMRSMARIGQAYSMGTGEYYWNNPESGTNISDELNALSKEDVNNAANKFLIAHDFQIVIVN
jgi:predicted Zn-dependent peptidase